MRLPVRHALLATAIVPAALIHTAAYAADSAADAAPGDDTDRIVVTGSSQTISTATPLGLAIKDTPQSVTIINRQRMDDFAITNVNDLLDQAVGVNVERAETDRTEYDSRGFDITNFQVDGIGLPMINGLQVGDIDTVLYDNVEIVRGANALMTGVGNPSATVNYVRKRPTDDLSIKGSEQFGSRQLWRAEGDINVPITDTLAVRAVYAHDEHNGYLDYNKVNRDVGGVTVRWEATSALTLTAGYTYQNNQARGVLWGALPLVFTDGTAIDWSRSDSTSADWTYWNTTDQNAFAEAKLDLGNDWSVKAIGTYHRLSQKAKLLYGYGYADKDTGEGLAGTAGVYPSLYNQYFGDLYLSGPFTLFGRAQSLALGLSTARSHVKEWDNTSDDVVEYGSVYDWKSQDPAEPGFTNLYRASNYIDRLTRAYGAVHLDLIDHLKITAGASAMWLKSTGSSYDVSTARKNSRVSPYAGAIYDVTGNISFYASYTDIFNPQTQTDVNNRRLDPAHGTSLEAGIKSTWFDGRLYATAAVFKAEQKNLANQIGTVGDGVCLTGPANGACYDGVDTTSRGFEIEVAGKVTDNWTINGGFTALRIHDQDGERTRTFIPTRSVKLGTTYTVPSLNDLKLGGQMRWQNGTYTMLTDVADYGVVEGDVKFRQKSYAVFDLMAGIKVFDHVNASVNVRNVGNKKYYNSLTWGQAYLAAPRSAVLTLSMDY